MALVPVKSLPPTAPPTPAKNDPVAIAENIRLTQLALLARSSAKTGTLNPSVAKAATPASTAGPQYIRYTANPNAPGTNPRTANRLIRIDQAVADPLEPSKFRHKKVGNFFCYCCL